MNKSTYSMVVHSVGGAGYRAGVCNEGVQCGYCGVYCVCGVGW